LSSGLQTFRDSDFFSAHTSALERLPEEHRRMMADIRSFNHTIIDQLDIQIRLSGQKVLDVGCAPQGYALERALQLGADLYTGIGLDDSLKQGKCIFGERGIGLLLFMDGMRMVFPANFFDAAVSMSAFEHIAEPRMALEEIFRVLAPGGKLLVTFEPVWTCSYGHHLHFLGDEVMRCVQPWSHLLLSPDEFLRQISPGWKSTHLTPEKAVEFVYRSGDINRCPLPEYKALLASSPFHLEWMVELKEKDPDLHAAQKAAERLTCSVDELLPIGLSALLTKPGPLKPKQGKLLDKLWRGLS
jgi:ubiquinone/menaquinone biosynthesis C-methylase UbiE